MSSFLVGLDAALKAFALHFVPHLSFGGYPFGGTGLFDFGFLSCSFNVVFNKGMAWGAFSEYGSILLVLRLAIVTGLLTYLFRRKNAPFALWLIASGAIGNILDMCIYGHVIDFIHIRIMGTTFPLFNFADSYITIGALLFVFFSRKESIVKQNGA